MIAFNNGVTNIKNTPGIISDTADNLPSAELVAVGTIYIETNTGTMKQSDGTNWYTIGGGAGATPGIDDVLAVNQLLTQTRVIQTNGNQLQIANSSALMAQFDDNFINFGVINLANLKIDYSTNEIYTINNNVRQGLQLNFVTQNYQLGDEQFFITTDTTNAVINTHLNSQKQGIQIRDLEYYFGDFDGVNNSNFIFINDGSENIIINSSKDLTIRANTLFLTGTLTVGGAHTNSGQHLKLNINGTNYVIQLLNP